jgi:polar amino acid transport system substrate-binding protein
MRMPPLAVKLLLAWSLVQGVAAHAHEVTVLFGVNVAPYVYADPNAPSGMEVEVFRAALAVRGHTFKPVFVEREAMHELLRRQRADAAQRGGSTLREGEGFFYASEPTVPYRDVAVTLRKHQLAIFSVADLRGKSVVAFPGAIAFLGAEFHASVRANPHYAELGDETRKIGMLLSGAAQVYVGDVNVFEHLMAAQVDPPEVLVHRIFLPTTLLNNNAVFRDPQLRDDFNVGLRTIRANGVREQIMRRYAKRFDQAGAGKMTRARAGERQLLTLSLVGGM